MAKKYKCIEQKSKLKTNALWYRCANFSPILTMDTNTGKMYYQIITEAINETQFKPNQWAMMKQLDLFTKGLLDKYL